MVEDDSGQISKDDLLQSFHDYQYTTPAIASISSQLFARYLLKVFPHVTTSKLRDGGDGKRKRVYCGIKYCVGTSTLIDPNELNFSAMSAKYFCFEKGQNGEAVFYVKSKLTVNGIDVLKKITVDFRKQRWTLQVRDKIIDLERLGVSDMFDMTSRNLENILFMVNLFEVCTGIEADDNIKVPANVIAENIGSGLGELTSRNLRCSTCLGVLTLLFKVKSCHNCTENIRTFIRRLPADVNISETDQDDMSKILAEVFPGSSAEMQRFLKNQHEILTSKKGAIRWDQDTIRTCLELWCRSPRAYENLKGSNLFNLPCGRTLQKYKNIAPQNAAINKEVFEWMFNTAKKVGLPDAGYHGGIIHDETKIQESLVLNVKGRENKLIGFVETGVEGESLRTIKSQKVEPILASEVLQVTFLGYTGFRFPIAHYPTNTVSAAELYGIIWDIISELQSWGFIADFILQDGGDQNRQFMKMHFEDENDAECKNYLSPNLTNMSRKIAHSQDFSHNIKKLRNAVLSSGLQKQHTRYLRKGDQFLVWEMWLDAVKWDEQTNSRRVNKNITTSHMYPDSAEKMRNHYAEEMLDQNFLYLMRAYQKSLRNGSVLNSAIDFLEQTSLLISIFRDRRPISSVKDNRLSALKGIREWFREWKKEIEGRDDLSPKEKEKSLPSKKCLCDHESLISTFIEICHIHLKDFPSSCVYPSRFNSDVIENNFCQVRGIHNGNSTNPTYHSYSNTMNSVILGQSAKSRGRKCNAGQLAADPYSYCTTVSTFPKKRKVLGDVTNKCQ